VSFPARIRSTLGVAVLRARVADEAHERSSASASLVHARRVPDMIR
jgi:hypothetical protein